MVTEWKEDLIKSINDVWPHVVESTDAFKRAQVEYIYETVAYERAALVTVVMLELARAMIDHELGTNASANERELGVEIAKDLLSQFKISVSDEIGRPPSKDAS